MRRFSICSGNRACLPVLLAFVMILLAAGHAYPSAQVASLTEYSGAVIIQSQGDWGVKPERGLPLYSSDKVVTRTGTAVVTFNDGAVLEIRANSNLLIEEQEKTGSSIRNLRLLLGKISFKTGIGSKFQTNLQTPTSVAGLRGTAGVLSISVDGQPYIQFTEGGMSYKVGDFISGVAKDVPAELADLNPAQRAAFVASAAADQAKNAASAATDGKVSEPQAALAAAKAAEAAAVEAKTAAETMMKNPDPVIQAQAQSAVNAAVQAVEAAKQAQQKAIDAGAKPDDPKTYTPADLKVLGFDTPVTSAGLSTTISYSQTTTTTTTTSTGGGSSSTTPSTSIGGSASITTGGFLESGALSIDVNDQTSQGSIHLTGNYNLITGNAGAGGLSGTLGNGSQFEGYLGGVIGSWQGLLASIYVTTGKGVGFLTGVLDGTYDPSLQKVNADGEIIRSPVLGFADITPEQLSDALKDSANRPLFAGLPAPVIGSMTAGGTILKGTGGAGSVEGLRLQDNTLVGVWNTIPAGEYTYSNPDGKSEWTGMYANNQAGYYSIGQLTGKDDLLGHLALGGDQSFISRRYLGTVGVQYRAKYDTSSRSMESISAGTYLAKPLNFVSDVQAAKLTGLLGGTESLWSASTQTPASLTFMGSIYPGSDRVLDIQAADGGSNGGFWSWPDEPTRSLFPGGLTHVRILSNQNSIADLLHPIVQGLTNSDYSGWNYTSHGYFTNLPANARVIMTDAEYRPTVLEYAYGNGLVIGSMQTLEWTLKNNYAKGGLPLKNTLSYAVGGGGRVLLVQDVFPWYYQTNGIGPNEEALRALGIPYDVSTSADFAAKDLSQYAAIVISSDQTQQFYDVMSTNISQMATFLSLGEESKNYYSWQTTLFSHNYDNGKDTTYDGGSYYGVIGGNRIANTLQGDLFLVYIDPNGNAGIIRGDTMSTIYPDLNSFSGTGQAYNIALTQNIGILPENLRTNIVADPIRYLGGEGSFFGQDKTESGALAITSSEGSSYSISTQNWGVWSNSLKGTFSGDATDSWVSTMTMSDVGQVINSSPKINHWATVDGSKWSGQEVAGKISGAWVNWDKAVTGVVGGTLKGTFNPTTFTWQAIGVGAHLETGQFLEMVAQGKTDALQKLNIPCIEIGKATLSGNSDLLKNVQMKDVTFFAYSTGASPRIWATNNVSGDVLSLPGKNHTVGLSGGGLSANFTVQNWGTGPSGNWGANVSGGGGLTRNDGGNPNVTFQGAAAGTYGPGKDNVTQFKGTGAGTAATTR